MSVVLNPEFGSKDVVIALGVRMLKHATMSMGDILNFIDNEVLVTVKDAEDTDTSEVEVTAV
jgi:hypothetical protein